MYVWEKETERGLARYGWRSLAWAQQMDIFRRAAATCKGYIWAGRPPPPFLSFFALLAHTIFTCRESSRCSMAQWNASISLTAVNQSSRALEISHNWPAAGTELDSIDFFPSLLFFPPGSIIQNRAAFQSARRSFKLRSSQAASHSGELPPPAPTLRINPDQVLWYKIIALLSSRRCW